MLVQKELHPGLPDAKFWGSVKFVLISESCCEHIFETIGELYVGNLLLPKTWPPLCYTHSPWNAQIRFCFSLLCPSWNLRSLLLLLDNLLYLSEVLLQNMAHALLALKLVLARRTSLIQPFAARNHDLLSCNWKNGNPLRNKLEIHLVFFSLPALCNSTTINPCCKFLLLDLLFEFTDLLTETLSLTKFIACCYRSEANRTFPSFRIGNWFSCPTICVAWLTCKNLETGASNLP